MKEKDNWSIKTFLGRLLVAFRGDLLPPFDQIEVERKPWSSVHWLVGGSRRKKIWGRNGKLLKSTESNQVTPISSEHVYWNWTRRLPFVDFSKSISNMLLETYATNVRQLMDLFVFPSLCHSDFQTLMEEIRHGSEVLPSLINQMFIYPARPWRFSFL